MLRLTPRDGYLAFDGDECRKFGRSLANEYQNASPFPHIVIDDFLPSDLLKRVLAHFPSIAGLISDPHFVGGGLHETKIGGHLGIHADFNIHEQLKLERKLNLLIYLNEDWPEEFGGALELWDRSMRACEKKVAPLFGRAVI